MSKKILTFALATTLLISACNPGKKTEEKEKVNSTEVTKPTGTDVPFTEAKNYLVKNDYKDSELHSLKITTQKDFDKIFGMAATMEKEGKPTPVDFSRQYIIACIGKISDKISALEVSSLKKIDNTILLTCNQTEGEKQSFISRHFILLIVDNEYQGEIKLQKK